MYLCCTAAEDEGVQKRGIVCLLMNMGPKCSGLLLNGPTELKLPMLLGVVPVRFDAIHIISDKPSSLRLLPQLWSAIGPRIRMRSRYYTGTYVLHHIGILTFSRKPVY